MIGSNYSGLFVSNMKSFGVVKVILVRRKIRFVFWRVSFIRNGFFVILESSRFIMLIVSSVISVVVICFFGIEVVGELKGSVVRIISIVVVKGSSIFYV